MPVRRALAILLALPVFAAIYVTVALRRGPATRIALALGIGGLMLVAAVGDPAGTVGADRDPGAARGKRARPAVSTSRALISAMLVDFDAAMDATSVADAIRVERRPRSGSAGPETAAASPCNRSAPRAPRRCTRSRSARRRRTARGERSPDRCEQASSPGPHDGPGRRDGRPALRRRPRLGDRALVRSAGSDGTGAARLPHHAGRARRAPRRHRRTGGTAIQPSPRTSSGSRRPSSSRTRATPWISSPGSWTRRRTRSPFPSHSSSPRRPRLRWCASGRSPERRTCPAASRSRSRSRCPSNPASTSAAFSVDVNSKESRESPALAENNTVLVFDPAVTLPYEATVILRVGAGARAADGTALDRPRAARFTVAAKPEPSADGRAHPKAGSGRRGQSDAARDDEHGRSPPDVGHLAGGREVPSLAPELHPWRRLGPRRRMVLGAGRGRHRRAGCDAGISDEVARPYAKRLAGSGVCSHFSGGSPGDRLRAAGYTSYHWAERMGCRYYNDPRDAAVGLVRFYQSEKFWSPVRRPLREHDGPAPLPTGRASGCGCRGATSTSSSTSHGPSFQPAPSAPPPAGTAASVCYDRADIPNPRAGAPQECRPRTEHPTA